VIEEVGGREGKKDSIEKRRRKQEHEIH